MTGEGALIGVWRGDARVDALDARDRGLAYGDGLFETLRAHAGTLPWWPRHRARLLAGAQRLGLPFPSDVLLDAALAEALAREPDGVVKLVLTRGSGARGYAPTPGAPSTLVVSVAGQGKARGADRSGSHRDEAANEAVNAVSTLRIDLLTTRLGVQPALAGMKHLNRLEQVLGAREASARGLDDGLMADAGGFVTCSTRANVVARIDGRWITPPVDRAGVAGIARGVLLEAWTPSNEVATTSVAGGVEVAPLPLDALPRLQALFLCNAVRGILVVGQLGARALDTRPPGLDAARAALAASHPAFHEP
ncbi:MAG TPA: aminodeoxychorismate lyase [Xanthomonadaceae bacterium]|jgi:4-amino-4-deoxychorismate lyase|nr:aminodeoxychorismate lyase [Xanthomonadaceae bacterium]